MRWTIRGVSSDTADAVRNVAFDTGSTLGEVIGLCIEHGLFEARRRLETDNNNCDELDPLFREIERGIVEIQDALSKCISDHVRATERISAS